MRSLGTGGGVIEWSCCFLWWMSPELALLKPSPAAEERQLFARTRTSGSIINEDLLAHPDVPFEILRSQKRMLQDGPNIGFRTLH